MKAPTADYSPLSQALNAKTSAIQASYSTKDTANWKSRYKIQTDSFKLQEKALENQEDQININGMTALAQGLDTFVEDLVDFVKTGQDKTTQEAEEKATNASNDINLTLRNNPQFSQSYEDNGVISVGLTDEGKRAVNEIVESYFPEGTKYGWGMDERIKKVKEQVLSSANTYAGEIATQRTQDEANAAYNNNMKNALLSDLQSGATITAKIPDVSAEGGYREVKVGAGQEALISSRESYMGKAWADNQRQIASADLINKRSDYLISDASTNFSNGTYVTDSSKRATFDSLVKTQAEEYTDETQKQAFLTSVKSAETQAVTTYFDNQVKTILDQDLDIYTSLSSLYDSLTDPNGQYYSIFFDKDGKPNANIEPSTYTTIKSSVSTQLSNIETLNGTTNTQAVQNAFSDLNNQFSMGQINSTTYGAKAQSIMVGIYGDNWMSNSEAVNVYKNQIMSQLSDDLASDPQVANGISIAYNTALGTNNKAYKDLDAAQKAKADVISKDYIDNVTNLILNNPDLLKDPLKFNQKLTELSSKYTSEWADIAFGTNSKVTVGDALKGTEFVSKTFDKVVSSYSTELMEGINENGVLDRSSLSEGLMPGVNEALTDAISQVAQYGIQAKGMNILDPKDGKIQFEIDESTGKPKLDKKGNLIPKAIIWTTVDSEGKVDTIAYEFSLGNKDEAWETGTQAKEREKQEKLIEEDRPKTEVEATVRDYVNVEEDPIPSDDKDKVERFLWANVETTAELDEAIETLNKQHEKGKFANDLTDSKEYQAFIDSVKFSVKEKRGWNETTQKVIPKDDHDYRSDNTQATLLENANTVEELNTLVEKLNKFHEEGKFASDITDPKQYQAYIDSLVFAVKQKKGWK